LTKPCLTVIMFMLGQKLAFSPSSIGINAINDITITTTNEKGGLYD